MPRPRHPRPRAFRQVGLSVGRPARAGVRARVLIAAAAPVVVGGVLVAPTELASAAGAPAQRPALVTAPVTYVVNTTADTPDADVGTRACADARGRCSLRAAVMQANFHGGGDTIRLPAGTFRLTRPGDDDAAVLGDLDLAASLTIRGAGSSKTIIDGNGAVTGDRVLQVMAGATSTTIAGVTIRGGRRSGTFDEGGGLLWSGGSGGPSALTLADDVIEGNRSPYGAGVYLSYGTSGDTVRVSRVTVRGNTASAAAGGLGASLGDFATLLITSSHLVGNRAYEGGGLYLQGAATSAPQALRVTYTEIARNGASLSGGFENHSGTASAPVLLASSEVHDNISSAYGGGIGNYGRLVVAGSTVASNKAQRGGGLYDYEGGVTRFSDTTVSTNSATAFGGAVYVEFFIHGNADVQAQSATFAGNVSPVGSGIFAAPGTHVELTSTLLDKGAGGAICNAALGGTISMASDSSCGLGAGDAHALRLGPLGWHGGPTRTHVPLAGSPAVDADTAAGPTLDQRGIPRPQGSHRDVGAVEVVPTKPPAARQVAPGGVARGPRLTLVWRAVAKVQTYAVVLRLGTARGRTVQSASLLRGTSLRTRALRRGAAYVWRVTAVGDRGTSFSPWRRVLVR